MEGVDNEVILTFFILVGCFIVAAVYLKSRRTSRSFRQSNQEVQSNNCLTLETERNSNTNAEQGNDDVVTTCDHVIQSRDNFEQNCSNKTTLSAATNLTCDGVRRCREQSDWENKSVNSKTNKTNVYTNENNEGSPAAIGTTLPSPYNTNVGPSTSSPCDSINSDFNTNSLPGTNVGSNSNTIGSYDTNMGPSTSSSYQNDLLQTASNPHTTNSTESVRRATIRVKYQETERSLTVDLSLKVGDLKRYQMFLDHC